MKIMITGGCGFLGSNLAKYGSDNGMDIHVIDNLSRKGSSHNLNWLLEQSNVTYHYGDVRNYFDVVNLLKKITPDAIFHLAGQVAMTTSIDNPMNDMLVNVNGSLNVLEAARAQSKQPVIIYSSTNKVYGDLENYKYKENSTRYECDDFINGISENINLDFRSPYGCSKGAADQYMLDYSRIYGMKTVVFRHSSMYGGRQYATEDQGWVGWFCSLANTQKKNNTSKPISISGTGKQVRDLLHSDDMCRLYFSALENIEKVSGQAYNVGGGVENSTSLLELFKILESKLGIDISIKRNDFRQSDQKIFVADLYKIQSHIGWSPKVNCDEGIDEFLEWVDII
jgi:CDP-paratose 2-epimerase